MTTVEIKNNMLNEIKELANKRYTEEFSFSALWGSASALLTIEQLEIIKSVMENK